MKKLNSMLLVLGAALATESFYDDLEPKKVTPKKNKPNSDNQKIKKGLKEFKFENETVWAINLKNAERKYNKLKKNNGDENIHKRADN